ncbi:MAG: hypothetical protein AB7P97_20865 [Hyphomonadaceae bacterium]
MKTSSATQQMEARKRAFLDALAITGVVTSACEATGVARKTAYHWRDADPDFADQWDEAIATSTDRLEAEAHRRAVLGVEEPVFHRGQLVFKRDADGEVVRDSNGEPVPATVSRRSDRLLELMLMAKRPEQYGRKTVDLNQRVERKDAPRPPVMMQIESLPIEARRRVLDMVEKIDAELKAAPVQIDDGFEDAF